MPTRDRSSLDWEELFVLWAARRSGVLGALLDTAGTAESAAAEAGVAEPAARALVESLADLGYLRRVGGEYEITNRALGFLAKRDVRSIGRLPHALDLFDYWTALPETMRTGEAPDPPAEWTRNRLGAHAATDEARVRARVTAAVREAPAADRVLDVCGASGAYATEFAARGFETTLVDEPAAVDAAAPMLAHRDVRTVAAGVPGAADFEAGGPFDLAFAAEATSRFDPAENRTLLSAAFDALEPGGTLVVVDALRDGSPAAVRARVRALGVGRGDAYPEETYRSWLDAAGFVDTTVRPVPGDDRSAVVARRPERAVD
ncbi:methyltransferase domain-containing protein [Halogeometricum sp. S1BR25-6]|uniref:Methyltransferase domain-containing protein n=1 Tax=Halogeometricum salsisoli TaxID=2950536 RepID=A0ABU2GB61_9EURY|nr:methyltransferase domain-containing protein [Halogeometricum sp. S1BR25-6]MDS0297726.1 methyltransferase domain-containing protein [Halogeometricum sp. S1BR25-6]